MVADARASTPTKAGVVAVPDRREVLEKLAAAERRLAGEINSRLELAGQKLETLLASSVFRNPLLAVRNREQQLDEIGGSLGEWIRGLLAEAKDEMDGIYEQIRRIEPHRLIGRKVVEVNDLRSRANAALAALIGGVKIRLAEQASRLAGLNPKAVLKRGYSITTLKQTGNVIKSITDVKLGDTLVTELAGENLIESKVTKK